MDKHLLCTLSFECSAKGHFMNSTDDLPSFILSMCLVAKYQILSFTCTVQYFVIMFSSGFASGRPPFI